METLKNIVGKVAASKRASLTAVGVFIAVSFVVILVTNKGKVEFELREVKNRIEEKNVRKNRQRDIQTLPRLMESEAVTYSMRLQDATLIHECLILSVLDLKHLRLNLRQGEIASHAARNGLLPPHIRYVYAPDMDPDGPMMFVSIDNGHRYIAWTGVAGGRVLSLPNKPEENVFMLSYPETIAGETKLGVYVKNMRKTNVNQAIADLIRPKTALLEENWMLCPHPADDKDRIAELASIMMYLKE